MSTPCKRYYSKNKQLFGVMRDDKPALLAKFQTEAWARMAACYLNKVEAILAFDPVIEASRVLPSAPLAQINMKLVEVSTEHLVFVGGASKPMFEKGVLRIQDLPLDDPKKWSTHFEDWFTLSVSVGKTRIDGVQS